MNSTAVAASQIVMPHVIRVLYEHQGYYGSILIYSGLILNCCVATALFQPVELHQQRRRFVELPKQNMKPQLINETEKDEFQLSTPRIATNYKTIYKVPEIKNKNTTIWEIGNEIKVNLYARLMSLKSFKVIILGIGLGLFFIGHVNFMMIPFVVMESGDSYESASYLVTTFAVSNTVSRLVMAVVADRRWFIIRVAFVMGSITATASCISE